MTTTTTTLGAAHSKVLQLQENNTKQHKNKTKNDQTNIWKNNSANTQIQYAYTHS